MSQQIYAEHDPNTAVITAAARLEAQDVEYTLQDLAQAAKLDEKAVLHVLKRNWIDEDHLDIVYLNLTQDEEALLYA